MSTTQNTCPGCDAPLADDQRYCLECGTRRNGARLPFDEIARPAQARRRRRRRLADRQLQADHARAWRPPGVALAVLFLGVGVLIGRAGSNDSQLAAKPTVVRVAGGAPHRGRHRASRPPPRPSRATGPPARRAGPCSSRSCRRTTRRRWRPRRTAAKDKGAPDVGLLDTDQFESLPPGNYIVYSGQFDSKAKASAALKKLKKDFPKAKVLHVGGSAPAISGAKAKADKQAVQQLDNLSGSDYAKQARKLPDTLALPGKPPPKDNKEGGGGSGFETIN